MGLYAGLHDVAIEMFELGADDVRKDLPMALAAQIGGTDVG